MKLKRLSLLPAFLLWMFLFSPAFVRGEEKIVSGNDSIWEETLEGEQQKDDGCNTAEELLAFLTADNGGRITLTDDILWDCEGATGLLSQSATVEMGEHKIIIPAEGSMQIQGNVVFRGSGDTLLEVEGHLNLSYGVEVLSSGAGASAIRITESVNTQFYICRIEATGEGAVAIRSNQPVRVELCSVTGKKAAIEAPDIIVDGSDVFPLPEGVAIVERVAALDRSLRLYGFALSANISQEEYEEAIYGMMNYNMVDPVTGQANGCLFINEWKGVPQWPPKEGSHTLTVIPRNCPEWFPVDIPEFTIPLHIISDVKPWLHIVYSDPYLGFINISFEPNAVDREARVSLYYSVNEGVTWRNVLEDFPQATVGPDFISVENFNPDTNYLFYADVVGGRVFGKTNILYYPNYTNDLGIDYNFGGGDSDEDDFGDQGEKPPSGIIIPAPEQSPTSETTVGEQSLTSETTLGEKSSSSQSTIMMPEQRPPAGAATLAPEQKSSSTDSQDRQQNTPIRQEGKDIPSDSLLPKAWGEGTKPIFITENSGDKEQQWGEEKEEGGAGEEGMKSETDKKQAADKASVSDGLWIPAGIVVVFIILKRRKRGENETNP